MSTSWKGARVIVTGGAGFLGSRVCALLRERGCEPFVPRSEEYDLRYRQNVERMFHDAGKVDVLINLAANVGGIGWNQAQPYDLYYDNAMMGGLIIDRAIKWGVGKIVQVGTTCSYPKFQPVPFDERGLWNGYPEETNAPYGLAKKNLLVQLQAAHAQFGTRFAYLIPTNLYGPGDEFNPVRSHVIPALVRKCVEAREVGADHVEAWGTGDATRDFLYVDDCAEALLLAAERYDRPEPLNVGSGQSVTILWLMHKIMELSGFRGRVEWDDTKPDGQPKRQLSTRAMKHVLGWEAKMPLEDGLRATIAWYEAHRREAVPWV